MTAPMIDYKIHWLKMMSVPESRAVVGRHDGINGRDNLNEFTFRFNRRFYPFNAFRSLLGIAGDTSAPTYAELYSGEWRHPTCSGHGR